MDATIASMIISLVALVISVLALVYTIRTYLLKSGSKFRCSYSIGWSREADDLWVQNITIENLKDKPIVVFKIYLRIGVNNYLQIDDFENDPLILKPFGIFKRQYDPVAYYDVAANRMDINGLLRDRTAKRNVVLSTSNGRYEAVGNIKQWDAFFDFLNNYYTVVIKPARFFYRDVSYGSRIRFIVDITREDESHQVTPIQEDDYKLKKFQNFQLTRESLLNKHALADFFEEQKKAGNIGYKHLRVIDFQEQLRITYNLPNLKKIEVEQYGKIEYLIKGRWITKWKRVKDKKDRKRNETT